MNSKEALTLLIPQDVQTFIEFRKKYNCAIKSVIYKDLERLEKLEKAIEILKDFIVIGKLNDVGYLGYTDSLLDNYLTPYEYELLKEVLE